MPGRTSPPNQPQYLTSPRTGTRRRNPNYKAEPTGTVADLYVPPSSPRWGNPSHAGYAPPENISHMTQKAAWVPLGLNAGMFSLSTPKEVDPLSGQSARRYLLDKATPKLQNAISSGNIFAYNAALTRLRADIERTAYGEKVPLALPDRMMVRKKAIRRAHREAPVSSRALTLGLV